MAIDLPTASLEPTIDAFTHLRPILSGDDVDADRKYGFKGLSSESNHIYSLGQCLGNVRRHDNGAVATDATGGYVDAAGPIEIEIGADIAYVAVLADIADGSMKVIVEADSNTGGPYGARGNQTVIVTLSDTTGLLSNITIQIKKNVTNCILYGAKIYEVTMVAGDFP